MPDPTPGPETPTAGTVTAPPASATPATPPQDANQPPPTQVPDAQPEAEALPATPEEFKSRLEAERKKVLDDYRAKAGREAGWLGDPRMQGLSDAEKQEILSGGYSTLKAKIEAYERSLTAMGQKAEPKPEAGPDPLELEAEELVQAAKDEKIEAKDFYRRMVGIQQKIARREAERVHEERFQPSYDGMTRQQQIALVTADPRWKDERVQAMVVGIIDRDSRKGKPPPPLDALEKACTYLGIPSPKNGNGHAEPAAPAALRVTPAMGEARTVSQPATSPSLSLSERFARTASGKAMQP